MLCYYDSRGEISSVASQLPPSYLLVASKLLQNGGNLAFFEANFVELRSSDFCFILYGIFNILEKTRKIGKVFIFCFLPVFSGKILLIIIT